MYNRQPGCLCQAALPRGTEHSASKLLLKEENSNDTCSRAEKSDRRQYTETICQEVHEATTLVHNRERKHLRGAIWNFGIGQP
jgi:hypothetical protein